MVLPTESTGVPECSEMTGAIGLYESLGFRDTDAYRFNPLRVQGTWSSIFVSGRAGTRREDDLMAELKTRPTDADVDAHIERIEDESRREDCRTLLVMMKRATGADPLLWGNGIIGFGDYHYRSPSTGREGDWFETGFASRKANIAVYILPGLEPYGGILERLGKYKTGVVCLYLKRLSDVDVDVLEELVTTAVKELRARRE
jgi:hypothetical protein